MRLWEYAATGIGLIHRKSIYVITIAHIRSHLDQLLSDIQRVDPERVEAQRVDPERVDPGWILDPGEEFGS